MENLRAYTLATLGATQGVFRYIVQPELSSKRAWLCIGLGVLAYELAAPSGELLSEGVDEALKTHPIMTRAAIGYTALHLMNYLPTSVDLFNQATKLK